MIHIILVDDHPLVREGIKAILRRDSVLSLLAEADHGAKLPALFKAHGPRADLLLLDINMSCPPVFYPEAVIPRLLARFPLLRILVLSGDDRLPVIQKMMALGVSGYILKDTPESLDELPAAIRVVFRGERFYSRRVLRLLLEAKSAVVFSPREADVARLLVRGVGNKGIAARLFISEKYVEKLVAAVKAKLAVPDSDNAGYPVNTRVFMAAALKELGY